MKLEFRGFAIENFKLFRSTVLLDLSQFPVGLHFVRGDNQVEPALGSNGAGKSSLFDALCWCLYGKTTDGLRGPDICPWVTEGSDVGDGSRWIDPKRRNAVTSVGVTIHRDGEAWTIIRSTSNGLRLNGDSIGQEQIDRDIMPFAVFTNTLLLGQGRPLFFDLKPQEKMDLFVDVLQLDRWDERSQAASDEAKTLTERQVRLTSEIAALKKTIEDFTALYKSARQSRNRWDQERSDKEEEFRAEHQKLTARAEELLQEKNEFEGDNAKLPNDLSLAKKRLREETEDLQALDKEYVRCRTLRQQAKDQLAKLLSQLEKLEDTEVCPTCGQPVQDKDLDKHRAELEERIAECRSTIKKNQVGQLVNDIVAAKDIVEGTRAIMNDLESKCIKIVEELQDIEVARAEIDTRLSSLEKQLSSWKKETNPYAQQVTDLRSKLKTHRERAEELADELDKVTRRISRVRFWVTGFKACRLYLLEEILQELKLVSNAILPELGLDGWSIDYDVEKETKSGTIKRGLNVSIVSPESDRPVRWESFSGGERQRLRLVGALSLSEVLLNHAGIDSDLEILDEPTRHLSGEGIRNLCESLPLRSQRLGRRTFYVDHAAIESSSFSSVLTVLRTKDGVSLETR